MYPTAHGANPAFGMIITVVIVVAVLVLRNRRPRKLRIEALWIRPVLFFVAIALALAAAPPPLAPLSVALMALAVVIGAGLGWQRGRFMRIDVHPETHDLTSTASPVGMIFIVAILALRIGMRGLVMQSHAFFGLPATAITDALILLVGAMIVTQSLEMWLRARRLLAEAIAAKAGAVTVSPGANPPIVR
jgi:hypothetical protein